MLALFYQVIIVRKERKGYRLGGLLETCPFDTHPALTPDHCMLQGPATAFLARKEKDPHRFVESCTTPMRPEGCLLPF